MRRLRDDRGEGRSGQSFERVCDHLVILAAGRVQLAGSIEAIVANHRLLTGPRGDPATVARVHEVIRASQSERQTTVRANGHVYDSRWQLHEVDLEEIVLAFLGQRNGSAGRSASTREAVAP